jgi:iron complex transport system ATP-binding protein
MIGVWGQTIVLGGRKVLHDVDFVAMPGEFVAVCGPNGAGKTTLLRALAGLLRGGTPDPKRVAYVEQGARCAWAMPIREVVALGRIPHQDRNGAAIDRALAETGLTGLQTRLITQVSGGQARRAMLARALATEPDVLLLDEPVADLDPAAANDIMALLAKFAADGRTAIAVVHAVELAVAHATRLVVMADGRIVADAPPELAAPAAAAAFGMGFRAGTRPMLIPAGKEQRP